MIGKKINQLATELAPESTDLTIIGDPTTGVSKKITIAQLGAIFSGAVSFYTNLASFPATGDINVIYCAKDTQKLYLWSGSAYVEVFPSQALLNTYQLRSEKGVSNGYASLDSGGKVPISQLPSSIMEYKGTWNAATNTPTLANGTGDTGDVYICNAAGTVNFGAGPITFAVGDYVIYSGTIWQRSSGAVGTVTSVAITESGDALTITGSPITTSGTINIGFAGTGTQYIKGDGTLATFPSIISQATNLVTEVYNSTGATLTKGTVVYINGGQGNLPTITKALATGDSTSAQTYGIVQSDITNMNNGYVVVAGRIGDLDTQAFSNGTQLYLSSTTAGTYTSTKQYAPNHLVYVGIVVRAHPTQGVIEVKIQNGYEMDELHNVAAQSPSNNDGIFWEASTSLWKNKSIATVLGYTPANAATYVPYTGATANVDLGAFDLSSRSAYLEGTASYQAGLLIKQRGLYNFVTGAYTQIVADSAVDLNIIHNQANTTRRRYALSVAALQDGDSFQYLLPRANGTIALTSQLTGGTVTSVAALTIGTSGTDLSSTVANGTTTPVITLNVPTASATNRGALSSTDWSTFNNKQNALTNPVTGTGTSGQVTYFNGTSTVTGSSNHFWDATNNRLGIGLNNPQRSLEIYNATADSHLRLSGTAPSVSLGEAITGSIYQAKFGLITANGQYVTGGVAGDFVILSQTGSTIFATSSTEKMRVQASGNVSIGNTNDTYKLDVTGTIRATGIIMTSGSGNYFATSGSLAMQLNGSVANDFQLNGGGPFRIVNQAYNAVLLGIENTGAATFSSTLQATSLGMNVAPLSDRILYISGNLTSTGASQFQSVMNGTVVNAATNLYGMYVGNNSNVNLTNSYAIYIETTGGSGSISNKYGIYQASSGDKNFFAGNVGIGTSTFNYSSSGRGYLAISGSTDSILELQANSAAAAYLYAGVSNVDLNTLSNRALTFSTNTTERMRITSGGNVGIGTTSPTTFSGNTVVSINNAAGGAVLELQSNGTSAIRLATSSSDSALWEPRSVPVLFATANTERMRITSGGDLQFRNTGQNGQFIYGNSNEGYLSISGGQASGTSYGANITLVSNDRGVTNARGELSLSAGNTGGSGSYINFITNGSERMRITSGGVLFVGASTITNSGSTMNVIGTSTTLPLARFFVNVASSLSVPALRFDKFDNNSTTSQVFIDFTINNQNTASGSITANGAAQATFTSWSDKRLKENIIELPSQLQNILALKPCEFDYKDGSGHQVGFIAQEMQEVYSDAVGKNAQGFLTISGWSKTEARLVKAIQELKQELDTLKNK